MRLKIPRLDSAAPCSSGGAISWHQHREVGRRVSETMLSLPGLAAKKDLQSSQTLIWCLSRWSNMGTGSSQFSSLLLSNGPESSYGWNVLSTSEEGRKSSDVVKEPIIEPFMDLYELYNPDRVIASSLGLNLVILDEDDLAFIAIGRWVERTRMKSRKDSRPRWCVGYSRLSDQQRRCWWWSYCQ